MRNTHSQFSTEQIQFKSMESNNQPEEGTKLVLLKEPVWQTFQLSDEVREMLSQAPDVILPQTREELIEMAMGGNGNMEYEVAYDVPGKGRIVEANVVRARNGVAVNYVEPYMRRREPDCMLIADSDPSDKPHFSDRFNYPFNQLRLEIFDWLKNQELVLLPFMPGNISLGYNALMIGPKNASFFAAALADLQGMYIETNGSELTKFRSIIYLAPPFRHTHCQGKQVVVHNRYQDLHEVFSLNLYPGPSAKKGIYGVLLSIGEQEGWITAHASTVQVVTPYDNVTTIMHEGASGGGKSEMLEHPHREPDGRLLLGENIVNLKKRYLSLTQTCDLHPVTDDMAHCYPEYQQQGKLVVTDAEDSWFLRVNHIDHYGVDPIYERICIHPPEPLIFLNIQAVPGATCLIWEHVEDEPNKPCPNPRVVLPRRMIPNIVNEPVEVDIRSFGVRTPPCTRENPSYGIMGLLHILPPSLAWLWRLVAPRGHANPSIVDAKGMSSEGVGSYWPFATGRRVDQANLLLKQIRETPRTGYTLIPNQYVGAWKCGFMPQWIARDYLARRGGVKFRPGQLTPSRCPLLGYALTNLTFEGHLISAWFLQVNTQPEIGDEGYDAGALILDNFFKKELIKYLEEEDLDPMGRDIIKCFFDGGNCTDYEQFIKPKSYSQGI